MLYCQILYINHKLMTMGTFKCNILSVFYFLPIQVYKDSSNFALLGTSEYRYSQVVFKHFTVELIIPLHGLIFIAEQVKTVYTDSHIDTFVTTAKEQRP